MFLGTKLILNKCSQPQLFRRSVHHWSALGKSFNFKHKKSFLQNIGKSRVGLFNIPQLTDDTGFYLLKENVINETDDLLKEISSSERKRPLVRIFDNLSDSLCRVADMADFVRVAHVDPRFRAGAEDACMAVSSLVETLNTNQEIYNCLKKVACEGDIVPLDEIDKRVTDLFLFDFQLSGIHLTESGKERFVDLNQKILMVGSLFLENCYKPAEVNKNKIQKHLQNVFSWTGDYLKINGLHSENKDPLVREAGYKIYMHPDAQQENRLDMLLQGRSEMARLVGFETFAHRALQGTLLKVPENVHEFLETLVDSIRPKSFKDLNKMVSFKAQSGDTSPIQPWDIAYYSNLVRKSQSSANLYELSNYLSLGACMEGLNNLFENLFDVTLEAVDTEAGEVWCSDVFKLRVKHLREGVLGYIYCDFFERLGKPNQDCHFTIQGGRLKDDGSYQKPIVVLLLNLNSPTDSVPSLLSPSSLENLFHEFGHAMHSMLGRTRYQHVTGTRCSTDFAEVPSVLMEYFALDPRVLRTFARHWKTGEVIPEHMARQFSNDKKLFYASETHLQVFYSLVDQMLHGHLPFEKSIRQMVADVHSKYHYHEAVPDTAWYLRFGHFVGYGAKYYSYLVSKSIASQIWNSSFRQDPFSKTHGTRLRECILKHGGEIKPEVLVQQMLGQELSYKTLSNSLLEEIH